jgi:hypothetical protein
MSFTKIQNSTGIDDKGVLKFSFIDGDGDIGLKSSDTSAAYKYDLFINYYEKQKGVFKLMELPDITFNSRIPYIESNSEDGSVKGEVEIEIFINNPYSKYDTIRFDAYILDRALNKSNIITTTEIIVKKAS